MERLSENLLPFDGEAYLLLDVFSALDINKLKAEIAWRQDHISLYGRTHLIPRLHAWYADPNLSYRYSKILLEPQAWTERLLQIRDEVELYSAHEFNSVLCNLYRSGRDKNGWHRDNEPELGVNPVIASVSVGATRVFSLRHREKKVRIDLQLEHGSLLIMKGRSQHDWDHQLVKTLKPVGERINLTFRWRNTAYKLAPLMQTARTK